MQARLRNLRSVSYCLCFSKRAVKDLILFYCILSYIFRRKVGKLRLFSLNSGTSFDMTCILSASDPNKSIFWRSSFLMHLMMNASNTKRDVDHEKHCFVSTILLCNSIYKNLREQMWYEVKRTPLAGTRGR